MFSLSMAQSSELSNEGSVSPASSNSTKIGRQSTASENTEGHGEHILIGEEHTFIEQEHNSTVHERYRPTL